MDNETLTFAQAKDKALRLIEFRAHSEKELRIKLKRSGAAEQDIDEIIEFCRRYKFIDDRAYAASKARELANLKKFGRRRIEQELAARGIAKEYISAAVDELDGETEEDKLLPLVEKRLRGDFDKKNRDRVIRYFMYRGYGLEDIKKCIERITENNGI